MDTLIEEEVREALSVKQQILQEEKKKSKFGDISEFNESVEYVIGLISYLLCNTTLFCTLIYLDMKYAYII